MDYKKHIVGAFEPTDERRKAFAQLLDAGPLTTGLVYRAELPRWRPDRRGVGGSDADLDSRFSVGGGT
jgi:hypothetical protein